MYYSLDILLRFSLDQDGEKFNISVPIERFGHQM